MADFKQVVGQYEELNKVSHPAIEFTLTIDQLASTVQYMLS
jgi:hypothetical protein